MSGVITGSVNLDTDTDRRKRTGRGSGTQPLSGHGQRTGSVSSLTAFRPFQTYWHLDIENLISKTVRQQIFMVSVTHQFYVSLSKWIHMENRKTKCQVYLQLYQQSHTGEGY